MLGLWILTAQVWSEEAQTAAKPAAASPVNLAVGKDDAVWVIGLPAPNKDQKKAGYRLRFTLTQENKPLAEKEVWIGVTSHGQTHNLALARMTTGRDGQLTLTDAVTKPTDAKGMLEYLVRLENLDGFIPGPAAGGGPPNMEQFNKQPELVLIVKGGKSMKELLCSLQQLKPDKSWTELQGCATVEDASGIQIRR
jgi:S-formylglutathione hydrolase FrmB